MKQLSVLLVLILIAVTGCGGPSDLQLVNRAQVFINEGQDNAAVIELKNALAVNPENKQARWLLGKVYYDNGWFADAEKELTAARRLGVADDSVLPLLARAWLGTGNHDLLRGLVVRDRKSVV